MREHRSVTARSENARHVRSQQKDGPLCAATFYPLSYRGGGRCEWRGRMNGPARSIILRFERPHRICFVPDETQPQIIYTREGGEGGLISEHYEKRIRCQFIS